MKVGTKSLLFGYHQAVLHPLMVAWAWKKLYGFPLDPREWLAFFVHDIGYWGKPNMDGVEGKSHPFFGAKVMYYLFDGHAEPRWYHFCLYHSRDMCRMYFGQPSQLCFADKLAFIMYPEWLLRLLLGASGEGLEYRRFRYDENSMAVEQDELVPFDEWVKQGKQSNARTLKKEGLEW